MAAFLHGVEVLEIDAGPRPIQTVRSSVIGIVGTAPDSAPEVKASLTIGAQAENNELTFTSKLLGVLGNSTSVRIVMPDEVDSPYLVTVKGAAITISLSTDEDGELVGTAAQLIAAVAAHPAASALVTVANAGVGTGIGLPDVLPVSYLSGGANEAFPLNTPVIVAGSRREAARLGVAGTLPDAMDGIFDQAGAVVVVVRVEEGADDAATLANILGGVDPVTGDYEGLQALLGAESRLGFAPRILIVPGFTHVREATANPVVAELIGIADRLRAIIVADGPNTTDEAAIQYANDFGSPRVYVCDPFVLVTDGDGQTVQSPCSARAAGVIARSDAERGFWWSPSNQLINGIVGTARPVDFALGDPSCRANLLNEAGIATIINQDGFRLWGNRSLASDAKWQFLCIRRTADMINDSILRAHLWAVDRGITATYAEDVVEGTNAYLRTLRGLGAIINGRCWADEELNTPGSVTNGQVYFNFDFSGTYPAERVTFRSQLVNDYLVEIF